MMRYTVIFLFLVISTFVSAQDTEALKVKNTIIKFFDAFHKQDSASMKSFVSKDIVLQSITMNKEGETQLKSEVFANFLKSIVSIPKDKIFKEKLLDFTIQIDGNMAHAWTPYEFWFDNTFSHCGVNSFQMVKLNNEWKIIYLIDTRRREGCQ